MSSTRRVLGLACVCLLAGVARAEPPAGLASREIALDAWGLPSVAAMREVQAGVLAPLGGGAPALVVYHVGDGARAASPVVAAPRGAAPPLTDGAFVVWSAQTGNRNPLGGFFNGFAKAPSRVEVSIEDDALTFEYDKRRGTFAGFWIHLFDTRARPAERVYLDVTGLAWLTFEVRGDAGGEPLRLQLADATAEAGQLSLPVDDVGALVPSGRIETTWQRAWVRLDRLGPAIERTRLANLVFLVDPESRAARSGRVVIRDVAFTRERVARPHDTRSAPSPKPERKAMWLWETSKMLASETELAALVAFCRTEGLTDLFVQIPYLEPRVASHWSERWDEDGMRRLVAALAPVRVYALDGAPWYAKPEWHARVVQTVTQVARFNRANRHTRIHGVRLDVEPYLLPAWQGAGRAHVLADYHALLVDVAAAAKAGGLVFGVDVPFWFDARDEDSGELAAPLAGGSAIEAVLDLVDDVGVMDYRTVAYGADGVIAHGSDELALAAARGKQVFIGLETVPLPDESMMTWDDGARSPYDLTGDLVVEPLSDGRARLTWVPPEQRRADGAYPWAAPGVRLLRQKSALLVPASKITFAGQGRAAIERTMARARVELARYPSFAGFVLHSYESYPR